MGEASGAVSKNSSAKELIVLKAISVGRNMFRNTWVHRLKITNDIYKFVFKAAFNDEVRHIGFRGHSISVPTYDVTIVPTLMTGEYEQDQLNLMNDLIKPGQTVFDIGANLGVYTLEMAKAVGAAGKVHAFEPVPANIDLLEKNIAGSSCTSNTKLHKLALGAEANNSLKIYIQDHSSGTHSSNVVSDTHITVKQTTLDSVVAFENIAQVDFIKIDVEGSEPAVLTGAMCTIKQYKPTIFMEIDRIMMGSTSASQQAITNVIDLYDYVYIINEKKHSLERVKNTQDVFKLDNSNIVLSTSRLQMP